MSGPVAQVDKSILFISQDSNNGGITALYRHFQVATQKLGWKLEFIDGKNELKTIKAAILDASVSHFHAVVLGGISAESVIKEIKVLAKTDKVVAGWHAMADPGASDELFINIATRSYDVAKKAAEYVVWDSEGAAGVVIFNDERFEVANAKTRYMVEVVSECSGCKVLSVENISLGNTVAELPDVVERLINQHGAAWTHSLAINDLYFDSINYPLRKFKRQDIRNISAGDGSFPALNRIRSGLSTQIATVAEPVALQGWQLADEINRAFAGEPPSGIVSQPILVTFKVANRLNIYELEENIPYKQWYQAIWRGHPEKIPKQ